MEVIFTIATPTRYATPWVPESQQGEPYATPWVPESRQGGLYATPWVHPNLDKADCTLLRGCQNLKSPVLENGTASVDIQNQAEAENCSPIFIRTVAGCPRTIGTGARFAMTDERDMSNCRFLLR